MITEAADTAEDPSPDESKPPEESSSESAQVYTGSTNGILLEITILAAVGRHVESGIDGLRSGTATEPSSQGSDLPPFDGEMEERTGWARGSLQFLC